MGFLKLLFGGGESRSEPAEFTHLLEKAKNGLALATAAHCGMWQMDEAEWSLNQDVGNLVFLSPRGIRVVAPAQIIGSFNADDETWLWSWANDSIDPLLTTAAKRLRAYGEKHGVARLTTRKFESTEEECWELTALAYLLGEAQGAYRGAGGSASVFMTFGDVVLSKREDNSASGG